LRVNEFWKLTPREFNFICKSFRKRQIDELNGHIVLAWQIGNFVHWDPKRYPSIESVIVDEEKDNDAEMTEQETCDYLKAWALSMGGKVVEI
jgi:hypothetical protein